jgi:electron transfer flavoprotein alpha subunit
VSVLGVLVVAEQRGGALNRATWEAIAAAQQTASPVRVAVLASPGAALDAVAAELAGSECERVIAAGDPALEPYTADGYVMALAALILEQQPSLVFFPHTYQTRDFAPALAARLDRALVTDVTAIKKDGERLLFVRPMFQGKLSADVAPVGPAPHLVTIQIGAFRADAVARGAQAPIEKAAVQVDAAKIRQKPEEPFTEAKQAVDLSQAARIVSVGRGIKAQENLKVAERLAQALGAELSASRPICDAGWLPMERQIGSSGQTVSPKLYVALGISGAIQHLVGMKGSRTIVAINKDPDAPIFEVADYGIVGDLFEVVPAVIAELEK